MKTLIKAAALALAFAIGPSASAGSTDRVERSAGTDALGASALLAVDRHRPTIVERIVNEWGDKLAASGGGLSRQQLREILLGMRADQLLAASLAGSLDGLKSVVVVAVTTKQTFAAKVAADGPAFLGNSNADLTYTPVPPCRLFDTRASQQGLGTPTAGVRRTYGAWTPVANQGGPGGCTAVAGAVVALIQVGTLTPSGNGLLQGGPQGAASFPNALILYQPGDQYGTAVAMPLNPANGQFDLVEQFATADLYGDLLGYFAPPQATPLECAPQQNAVQVDHGTFADVAVSCSAGYVLTGGGCMFFNLDGTQAAQNTVIVNRSAQTRDPVTLAWQNTWACRMTNNDPVIDFRAAARATCCRVPGR